jgi:hypothetical protein
LLRVGDRAELEGVRFVITLDADTQLLRDTARRMIETLAHPLNQARFSPDGRTVLRGYTIIQPRVSARCRARTLRGFRAFSPIPAVSILHPRGIRPVPGPDRRGNYHGKGIYDVQAFHRLLSGRFPEAHLLSHDLLEGVHVRVGLASDIELLDVFPSTYIAWWTRQHRWIRGDWQIIDWLKARVPASGGGSHPESAIGIQPVEDLRQSAAQPCGRRDPVVVDRGLAVHAGSRALEFARRRPAALAVLRIAARADLPLASAWDEVLARAVGRSVALIFHRGLSPRLRRVVRSRRSRAQLTGGSSPVGSSSSGRRRRILIVERGIWSGSLSSNDSGFPPCRRSSSQGHYPIGTAAVAAASPFLLLWAFSPLGSCAAQSSRPSPTVKES